MTRIKLVQEGLLFRELRIAQLAYIAQQLKQCGNVSIVHMQDAVYFTWDSK